MSNLPIPDADCFSLNELFKAGPAPLEAAEKMRKCSYVCNCLTWSLNVWAYFKLIWITLNCLNSELVTLLGVFWMTAGACNHKKKKLCAVFVGGSRGACF